MTTALTGLPRAFSPYGVGSYIRFFDDETDTPKDVYSDSSLTIPIADADLVADSASTFPVIFFDPSLYRIKVYNSSNVLKYLQDHFDPGLGAGFGVSSLVGILQGGTGAANAAAARANLGAASSSALTATQNDVTALQTATATGVNDDGVFGALAKEDAVSVDLLETGFGRICIQRVVNTTPSNNTTTSSIPVDTSIPQISEGTELFSQDFTPQRADSLVTVRAELVAYVDGGSGGDTVLALFKNSTADAVRSSVATIANLNFGALSLSYEESPGATSSITYKARMGTAATTLRVNASGAAKTLGGIMQSRLVIEEWVTK